MNDEDELEEGEDFIENLEPKVKRTQKDRSQAQIEVSNRLQPKKSMYDPVFDDMAYKQSLMGKDMSQIADAFMIGLTTLKRWINANPSFRAAIMRGRAIADGEVANAVYKSATGFVEVIQQVVIEGMGDGVSRARVIEVEKYHAPDAKNAQFWLTNRQADLWRIKREVEHSGEMSVTLDMGGASEDEGKKDPEFDEKDWIEDVDHEVVKD